MKVRFVFVLLVSLVLALGLTGIVYAQSICDTMTFTAGSAQPNGTDTVCGTVSPGNNVAVVLDGIEVGSAIADEYGDFCATFGIPGTLVPGTYPINIMVLQRETICPFDYVVEAAAIAPIAAAPAPVVTTVPARLPQTGVVLLPPVALLAGGLGMLFYGKRNS